MPSSSTLLCPAQRSCASAKCSSPSERLLGRFAELDRDLGAAAVAMIAADEVEVGPGRESHASCDVVDGTVELSSSFKVPERSVPEARLSPQGAATGNG